MATPLTLPVPSATENAHSEQLRTMITQHIQKQGGSIVFSDYMRLCLYEPNFGYYSAGTQKFGASGDFVTAPELSPLFARCLARQCAQILSSLPSSQASTILEFGAGSAKLAFDLLNFLEQSQQLPDHYFILEPSAELRARQQHYLQQQNAPWLSRVQWLDCLPKQAITGIIIANEVMDAMPIERFCFNHQGLQQCRVGLDDEARLTLQWESATPQVEAIVNKKLITYCQQGQQPYRSELSLMLPAWINSLSSVLAQGVALLFDYGYPRSEYYHPQRHSGTIGCYYKHHFHEDTLILQGIQDITAHIDFTLIAESAIAADLDVLAYTNQAAFLLACGLPLLAPAQTDIRQQVLQNQIINKLTLPGEMGEAVKVMALGREVDRVLMGFAACDRRQQL